MSASPSPVTSSTDLRVGGFTRLSSCDWPGELAATVFVQGCPWKCPYCHNAHLLGPGAGEGPSWAEIETFLATRMGLLDGVVFSGGEPLAQRAILPAMERVKAMGFKLALHTAGPVPERFAEVLPLLDWVGFDLKAPWAQYDAITGAAGSGDAARASFGLLLDSGTPFEVRTTVHPDLLGEDALYRMAEQLAVVGVSRWVLQRFRTTGSAMAAPAEPLDMDAVLARIGLQLGDPVVR